MTVCNKDDILWVKWIHSYVIRDYCIWAMTLPSDASWTLRKIFGLRRVGQQSFIKSIVGNGLFTHLWLDNWHSLGPLYQDMVIGGGLGQDLLLLEKLWLILKLV